LIETYLDHAGEKFSLEYDPNSLLYISKAMDLFDLGAKHQHQTNDRRAKNAAKLSRGGKMSGAVDASCTLTLPSKDYEEQASSAPLDEPASNEQSYPPQDLVAGLAPLKKHSVLVMGVASDILFPAWQQKEIADALRAAGTRTVEHIELGEDLSLFGHDTFLLDLKNIGGNVGRFLG
jgi:homoserine O-acetyltransferase